MHIKIIKSIHAILPVIAKHFIDKKKKKKIPDLTNVRSYECKNILLNKCKIKKKGIKTTNE